jgi:hypothetical protein
MFAGTAQEYNTGHIQPSTTNRLTEATGKQSHTQHDAKQQPQPETHRDAVPALIVILIFRHKNKFPLIGFETVLISPVHMYNNLNHIEQ